MPRHESLRSLAETVTVFTLYYVAGKLGLSFASLHPNDSPVWPAAGVALAALLVVGYRAWPAIFLGAFAVNVTTSGTAAAALLIAAGNTAEAIAGAWLVLRFASGRAALDTPRGVLRFLGASLACTMIAATVGVSGLALTGQAAALRHAALWFTWWLGDATGILIVAPLLLAWANRPRQGWDGREAEAIGLLAATLGAAWLVFSDVLPLAPRSSPLAAFCLAPLLWAGFRFGTREVATVSTLLAAAAVASVAGRAAPVAGATPNETLLVLGSFLGMVSSTALAVAA
jgi:integral membrane sensor domain MASE1